jgi:hypothetical protein
LSQCPQQRLLQPLQQVNQQQPLQPSLQHLRLPLVLHLCLFSRVTYDPCSACLTMYGAGLTF